MENESLITEENEGVILQPHHHRQVWFKEFQHYINSGRKEMAVQILRENVNCFDEEAKRFVNNFKKN